MKRFGMFVFTALVIGVTHAQTVDNQVVDAFAQQNPTATLDLKFHQFASCEQMDSVLQNYIAELRKNEIFRPMPMYREYAMAEDASVTTALPTKMADAPTAGGMAQANESYASIEAGFSTTNLQKDGVEEPEIIKTDGNRIYYYNRQEQKIYVMKSPFDAASRTITINNASIETVINLPQELYNLQLFTTSNRLVILGTRYRNTYYNNNNYTLDRSQRTFVIVYDTSSTTSPKLIRFTDIDGYYTDARMIGDRLYLLTSLGVNWYYYADASTTTSTPEVSEQSFLPKSVDVVNGKPTVVTPDCNQISYVLPSIDTVKNTNITPAFTIVSVIDTKTPDTKIVTNVMLAQPGQIHMSQNSLYLAQQIRTYSNWKCPIDAMCMMPVWTDGNQTLLHKFSVEGSRVNYQKSALIPGQLLTQYSMDEDAQGNFRILTKKYSPQTATDLYIFDSAFARKGSLVDIEPGEDFKASRYIGDKLYLVTFQQIDPLFVVDMANLAAPKIIGELKIPGYSTYLHPMGGVQNGKQYLIGLGYGVKATQRGGVQNAGIQLALYEVDYTQKETLQSKCSSITGAAYDTCVKEVNPENIRVSKLSDVTLGGVGSYSESLDNPRMFVMNSKNEVTIPLVLQDEMVVREECTTYPVYDQNGGVSGTKEYCQPITQRVTQFAGLKTFSMSPSNGIKEVVSKDYKDTFAKSAGYANGKELYGRSMYDQSMRVGYAGDALYMVANDFAHFFIPQTTQEKYLYFDGLLR